MSFEAVEKYARNTVELATRIGARRAEALAWCLLGESLLLRGRWDESSDCLGRSLALYDALGGKAGEALVLQRQGELAIYRGDWKSADEMLNRGLQLAVESTMPSHLMCRFYATLALNALEQGDTTEAARAVETAKELEDHFGQCPTCSALLLTVAAVVYAMLGQLALAEEYAAAAEHAAHHWEGGSWAAMAKVARGAVAQARGDLAQALHHFLAAAEAFAQLDQPFEAARARFHAGLIQAEMGESHTADELIAGSLAVFQQLGAAGAEARAREALGRLK